MTRYAIRRLWDRDVPARRRVHDVVPLRLSTERPGDNAAGEAVTTVDGALKTTSYSYDALGQVTRTTLPDASYQAVTYDKVGRAVSSSFYNPNHPDNPTPLVPISTTSSKFDAAGNLTEATDALGHVSTYAYDPTNLLVSQTEPVSAAETITSTFAYDLAGRRTKFTNGLGREFITSYNTLGLPESIVEPATTAYPALSDRTYKLLYDAGGRVKVSKSPGGVEVVNDYDYAGNLISQTGSGAEMPTATRTFEFDASGRMVKFKGSGSLMNEITYDDRNRPRSITGGGTGDTTFTYQPDGQLSSRTDASGTTAFDYDGAGRLWKVDYDTAGTDLTYGYNDVSALSQITYGTSGNTRFLTYDVSQRLKTDTLKTPGGTPIASIAYGWDLNGNVTSKTTEGFAGASANVFTYDHANRLTRWESTPSGQPTKTTTFQYDKAGNRTFINDREFLYDARNRLTRSTNDQYTYTDYAYTARGTLRTTTSTSGTVDTKADAFGQIIEQGTGTATEVYAYDALGRAIKSGHLYSGFGNDLAADTGNKYVRGVDGEVIAEQAGTSPHLLAWTDLHSDIVGQFTATGTALTASVAYDPLGRIDAASATPLVGSLGFQSEWTEQSTGRVNMAARWYNTDTGQFDSWDTQSNDPSPASINANRYAYGNGNPLVNTDPTGHRAVDIDHGTYVAPPQPVVNNPEIWCEKHPNAKKCKGIIAKRNPKLTPKYVKPKEPTGEVTVDPNDAAAIAAEIDATRAAMEEAFKARNKSFMDVLIDVGVGFLLDMLGVNDIMNCFTKGDLMACGEMILGFLPWGKVFKMAKSIFKAIDTAFSAYKAWQRMVKAADRIIELGQKTLDALEKAQTAIEITNTASELVGGGPILPNLPDIGVGGGHKKKGPSKGSGHNTKKNNDRTTKSNDERNQEPAHTDPDAAGGGSSGDRSRSPEATPGGDRQGSGNEACTRHSFDPATPVLMADGSHRPIKDVEVGDEVVATDPESGETTARAVTVLHRNIDEDLTDVTVGEVAPENVKPAKGGNDESAGTVRGPTVLHTTQHHPFWDATDKRWVDAAELRPGHELVGPAGERLQVLAVRNFTGSKEMRDLTVATIHTYYVIAGETPVLVHNVNGWQCETSGEGWDHVNTYHRPRPNNARDDDPRGKGVDDSKGVFAGTDAQLKALLEETVKRGPGRPNRGIDPITGRRRDGTKHEWDFGPGKGFGRLSKNDGGGEATGVRVILNPDGSLRTAHPI